MWYNCNTIQLFLMWPRHVKIHACCWCRNKAKVMLLLLEQNKSHIFYAETKQEPCCWYWNKTKAMLLMSEQKTCCWCWRKKNVFDPRTKQKQCCWCQYKQRPCCCFWNKSKAMFFFWIKQNHIVNAGTKKTMSLLLEQNKSHFVNIGTKQKPYGWCRSITKAMLLM